MERLGGYITQGVSTVAGPFHSFGGAVDIIVVEQEDGSFRSTPWYAKFGKVLGVIKRTEKTVAVAVNGVEANFPMHLDSSGHAYFLNEVESPEGEDARKSIVPGDDGCNGTNEVEGHYHDPYSQVSPLGGFVISRERKLAKKRLRQLKSIIGLVFRRKSQRLSDSQHVSSSLKSRQKTSDRLALIEMAEMAAELLERKWCTGYPKGIQRKQQNPCDDASLGDSKISPQVQSIETETDNSEVVLVTVDGHLIKAPVSPLDSGKRETDEYSNLNTDQSRISRTTRTENTPLTDIAHGSNLENTPLTDIAHGSNLDGVRSKMSKFEVSSKCVPDGLESVVTRCSSGPVSGNYSFNTESTEIYRREGSNDCIGLGTGSGKLIPYCLSLPLEGKGAASVQDFDCEDVTIKEFKSAGIAESVGALSAQHLDATESNRQSGRQKLRTNIPTSEQLSSLHLKGGQNIITFTFFSSVFGKQQVDARIYLWKWNSRVVVSDVDGTITKSDVLGHVMPFVGKDWSHLGVARLFSAIKDNGYEFLFLSARAISQAYVTRQLLLNLKQEGETLPDGPVVISPDGLFPSLYREVIRRAPHEFKIACLEDIKALFPSTGNPFYAGFGNRDTDELSYLKVGIPKGKIFTINSKGEVVVNRLVDAKSYTTLHKLVNDMFPSMPSSEHEDFNSWNYWRVPLPGVEDKV